MKKINYILVGVLIGILIQNQFKAPVKKDVVKNEEEIVDDSQITSTSQSIPIQKKDISQKPTDVKILEAKKNENLTLETSSNSATEVKPTIAPRKLELTFSEEVVMELETNLRDLPYQIKLSHEKEGLRVSYLAENSIFTKVGLQTGDLIRFEILQDLKNTTGSTSQLSNRLASIINYVR